jgi:hypothetical protein
MFDNDLRRTIRIERRMVDTTPILRRQRFPIMSEDEILRRNNEIYREFQRHIQHRLDQHDDERLFDFPMPHFYQPIFDHDVVDRMDLRPPFVRTQNQYKRRPYMHKTRDAPVINISRRTSTDKESFYKYGPSIDITRPFSNIKDSSFKKDSFGDFVDINVEKKKRRLQSQYKKGNFDKMKYIQKLTELQRKSKDPKFLYTQQQKYDEKKLKQKTEEDSLENLAEM